ncbi:L,D-transpeptidase [Schlegelella sp. S2-27]|uniref:L,D-transpeptidase n=1 Tax=Caldimonas mangrovi TaxID=2944811 RepID=A0ABT0YVI8_9BURK|nr:L,D-transpeptidase [Caldimonas mangrovi]MCM5682755.1 L,D-transpeptidase [Caldimonas mangrovi]
MSIPRKIMLAGMLASCVAVPAAFAEADFGEVQPAGTVRTVAEAAVRTNDPNGLPFAILDKVGARLYVFDAQGRLQGAAPVLLGLAKGDDSVPGIGQRKMSEIRAHERTTPAGRFVAEHGRNLKGEDIIWVDYDAAVSMHRLRPVHPKERRQQRLATPTPTDNRISYGCINVPPAFYDGVLKPSFDGRHGVVYVLPETRPLHQVFAFTR